jgi:MFS family permease
MSSDTQLDAPKSRADAGSGDTTPDIPPPYSVFGGTQKRAIVILAAFVGCLGTLSSFVYFPVIPALASDLHTSVGNINLSITAYLIVAALAPAIVGNAADTIGRRPTVVACLIIYTSANVGLAFSSSFAMLLCFRVLQAAGISGTFAITYGVLGDLFTPMERGGVAGIMSLMLNTPPSMGPVLSGLLMQRWGWRSIFWFLASTASATLLFVIFCLPETLRSVVGNGNTRLPRFQMPVLQFLLPSGWKISPMRAPSGTKMGWYRGPNPIKTLQTLRDPGTFVAVCVMAIYYTIYSCLQSSLSTLFMSTYQTSNLVTGLAYLPFGVGCGLGAVISGTISCCLRAPDKRSKLTET